MAKNMANDDAGTGDTGDTGGIFAHSGRDEKKNEGATTMEQRCIEGLGCQWYQTSGRCRAAAEILAMAEGRA